MMIVVLDGHTLNPGDLTWEALETLGEVKVYPRTTPEEFAERAAEADILLTNKCLISRGHLDQLKRLKFVSVLATGYNVVDVAAAKERGIPVSNVPGYGTNSVAQHVMAMVLELTNHVGLHRGSVRNGEWNECPDFCYWKQPLTELNGATMGIVGLGTIGLQVARLAKAFGMKIIYSGRSPKDTGDLKATHITLEELFSQADVITLHCSQTAENFEFVDHKLLGLTKPNAILINTARGTLVREQDLAEALEKKTLAGAALDVLAKEPPDRSNPLLAAPNCLITPHIAWSSQAARRRLLETTAGNIRSFLAGTPQNVVNGL
jgi:glycerate dehydrogenase